MLTLTVYPTLYIIKIPVGNNNNYDSFNNNTLSCSYGYYIIVTISMF